MRMGSKTVVPYKTKPRIYIVNTATAKFRALSRCKSTTGSFCSNSQMTAPTSPLTPMMLAQTMKWEPNQSSRDLCRGPLEEIRGRR